MPRNYMTNDVNREAGMATGPSRPSGHAGRPPYGEEAMAGAGPNPVAAGDPVAQAIQANVQMLEPTERAMLVDLINPQTLPIIAKLLGPETGALLAPLASTTADRAMSAAPSGMEPGAPTAQMGAPMGPPMGGGGGMPPAPMGGAGPMGPPASPAPMAAGPGGQLGALRAR